LGTNINIPDNGRGNPLILLRHISSNPLSVFRTKSCPQSGSGPYRTTLIQTEWQNRGVQPQHQRLASHHPQSRYADLTEEAATVTLDLPSQADLDRYITKLESDMREL
jgi:hypothetical protein